jgi:hypothetical protein
VVVDVLELVLKCHVGAANQSDVKAAPWVVFKAYPLMQQPRQVLRKKLIA